MTSVSSSMLAGFMSTMSDCRQTVKETMNVYITVLHAVHYLYTAAHYTSNFHVCFALYYNMCVLENGCIHTVYCSQGVLGCGVKNRWR